MWRYGAADFSTIVTALARSTQQQIGPHYAGGDRLDDIECFMSQSTHGHGLIRGVDLN